MFDVDELVTLLTEEKGDNICVIDIPAERKFVEHMVIVTGRSTRHLKAMAALIRWTVSLVVSMSQGVGIFHVHTLLRVIHGM